MTPKPRHIQHSTFNIQHSSYPLLTTAALVIIWTTAVHYTATKIFPSPAAVARGRAVTRPFEKIWLGEQERSYSCGAASLKYALCVLGFSPREEEIRRLAKTSWRGTQTKPSALEIDQTAGLGRTRATPARPLLLFLELQQAHVIVEREALARSTQAFACTSMSFSRTAGPDCTILCQRPSSSFAKPKPSAPITAPFCRITLSPTRQCSRTTECACAKKFFPIRAPG